MIHITEQKTYKSENIGATKALYNKIRNLTYSSKGKIKLFTPLF